jgi:hypothetical protein
VGGAVAAVRAVVEVGWLELHFCGKQFVLT